MRLASDAHLAAVGEDLVTLQTGRDRYLCVPDAAPLIVLGDDGRTLTDCDPELRLQLEAAGVLTAQVTGMSVPPRPPPPLPRRDRPPACGAATAADLRRLSLAVADLALGYAGRPLGAVLRAARSRAGGVSGSPDELFRLAAVFHEAAPWLPIPGKCLARSFVLRRFLQRSGADAQWVFGVRTWPFSAHCWLQAGEVVLDDHAERLHAYTPILAA